MSGCDHSKFFDGFGKLIEQLEAISGKEMDLTDLLSLRSDNGVPSAVYGGALQVHPKLGLSLSFGSNHFAVTQSGKSLSIGSLSGELQLQTTYCTLYWEVAVNDDYDCFFAIPVKKDIELSKDIFKKEILGKNNLAAFVREQSTGGKFTNYGNCPRVDGLGDPLKPATMEDGTYILTGIAHGVLVKKDDGKEFDSVLGYLADGTRISLNSYAKSDFIANPSSFRFPLQWKMHHLDANRTRSTLCNISAPTTAKTVLPARFAAFANAALPTAPAPTKSALVGGSTADFGKEFDSVLAAFANAALLTAPAPTKVAADGSSPDDFF